MEDNNYPQSFNGQTNRNYAGRASSIMDPTHQGCLDTMAAMQHFHGPVTMWHQSQNQQPGLHAMSMMAQNPNHQHNSAAYSMMLQSHGQRYYQAPMKMLHQALQQAQGSQLFHASIACSKRFSEDEKQKLEKVFTDETQKPSTNRKRQLAEELGCPIPKVNVRWRATNRLESVLTSNYRTGSRTDEQGRNSCTESRPMKPVRQLILWPPKLRLLISKRKKPSTLRTASSTV